MDSIKNLIFQSIDKFVASLDSIKNDTVNALKEAERIRSESMEYERDLKARLDDQQKAIKLKGEELDKLKKYIECVKRELDKEIADQRTITEKMIAEKKESDSLLDASKKEHDRSIEFLENARKEETKGIALNRELSLRLEELHREEIKIQDRRNAIERKEKEIADRWDNLIRRETTLNEYQTDLNLRAEKLKGIERRLNVGKEA